MSQENELKEKVATNLRDLSEKAADAIEMVEGQAELDIELEDGGYVFRFVIFKKGRTEKEDADKIEQMRIKAEAITKKNVNSPYALSGYFLKQFKSKMNYEYSNQITTKELGMMKTMLREYDGQVVRMMIDVYLHMYESLPKHSGPPSIPAMVGYRRHLHDRVQKNLGTKTEQETLGVKL